MTLERLDRWEPTLESRSSLVEHYYSPELNHTQLIELKNNGLIAQRRRGSISLEPLQPDTVSADGLMFRFERNEQGRIAGYRLDAGRVKNLWYARIASPNGEFGLPGR